MLEPDDNLASVPRALLVCREELDGYFRGLRRSFTFPYVFAGTPFQQSVWRALMEVPYGTTISYKELAAAVGRPDAVRAVGHANGRNLLSIVIPCHRIIGSNGSLTGYAGGLHRKEWLLRLERDGAPPQS
ncbi:MULTISPECIES: methylated-DNA--[protein]-cysteine S-methyltransferase [unclassified Paenibacillus]|uniref:methylated-DNA--[protein]-cysteine S-methyltransferase n=1 Tax=unclassified Paenibacillus TaxID=185978 RepID=UPI002109DBD4|nr:MULTISPECIES: methylated-DNA--[protein]-cysteine S-methyltransferase [unclassified Paenibacillus]